MATGYDIWGVVASVIGFLSIFQIIAVLINSRLPLKRLQVLEETLRDAESLLASVEEEGLFDDHGVYLSQVKHQVSNICKRVERIRNDAFAAKTYADELKQWWSGISNDISVCYKEVRHLRANISTTSSEARKALAQRRAESEILIPESDGARDFVSEITTNNDSSFKLHGNGAVSGIAENARLAVTIAQRGIVTPSSIVASTQDHDSQFHSLGIEVEELSLETYTEADSLEKATNGVPPSGLQAHADIGVPPVDTSPPRLNSTDALPSYRRQSSLPQYPSFPALTATVLLRCTITPADAARATRKLVKAYRRNLMVHNVPWQSPWAQRSRYHATSAAASARAVDRPSNATHHWKLLEQRAGSTVRLYLAVMSLEANSVTSLHVAGTVEACRACRCSCSNNVQRPAV